MKEKDKEMSKDMNKDMNKHMSKDTGKEKQEPDKTNKINKAALGSTATEAWADAETVDKKTKMNFPSKEAVEDAKEWVEENKK